MTPKVIHLIHNNINKSKQKTHFKKQKTTLQDMIF